jgi:hypothetical protein
MVESEFSKLVVVGSSPIVRSNGCGAVPHYTVARTAGCFLRGMRRDYLLDGGGRQCTDGGPRSPGTLQFTRSERVPTWRVSG